MIDKPNNEGDLVDNSSRDDYRAGKITPEAARHYIERFAKHTVPGTAYVDFPSGRISFDSMTDEQAIKVANGLLEIEFEGNKGRRQ